jgi:integrase
MANRTRSYLHAAFAFALQFDLSPQRKENDPLFNLQFNPVTAVPKALKSEKPSDRALTEQELADFWQLISSSQLAPERKILLKLIITLGGRRVNEVIKAPWSEFNLEEKLWYRSAKRDKKGKYVLMPIGKMAEDLLFELQKYTGNKTFLFGSTPPTDYAINQTVQRLIKGKIDHFTPKALRATAKTLMGKIGISKEARDRYHSHALNDVSSKHYDKFDYLDQKKEVVHQWESFLTDIITDNNL